MAGGISSCTGSGTWVASRHPGMQFQAVDVVRAGSRGKPFWHAGCPGDLCGCSRRLSTVPWTPAVARTTRTSARGISLTWPRVLPASSSHAGAHCWTARCSGRSVELGMDGSVTPQAEMASKLARWSNAHPDLWKPRPVKGDVGIVFLVEEEDFNSVQSGGAAAAGGRGGRGAAAAAGRGAAASAGGGTAAGAVSQSLQGAYQAFFDSNIQADFVSVDHIGEYPMIYGAYPEMLKKSTADKLRDYVAKAGKLISEGGPGYFGDGGNVGTAQPTLGLDELVRRPRDLCPVHSLCGQADPYRQGQTNGWRVLPAGV